MLLGQETVAYKVHAWTHERFGAFSWTWTGSTTATLNGGRVPGVSRGFHLSQPLGWITPPWLSQPGTIQPLAPTQARNEQEPVTLKNNSGEDHRQRKAGGGRRGERKWLKETSWHRQRSKKENQEGCSKQLGMRMPKDRGPLALKTLLVVNSFKLHWNASSSQGSTMRS